MKRSRPKSAGMPSRCAAPVCKLPMGGRIQGCGRTRMPQKAKLLIVSSSDMAAAECAVVSSTLPKMRAACRLTSPPCELVVHAQALRGVSEIQIQVRFVSWFSLKRKKQKLAKKGKGKKKKREKEKKRKRKGKKRKRKGKEKKRKKKGKKGKGNEKEKQRTRKRKRKKRKR